MVYSASFAILPSSNMDYTGAFGPVVSVATMAWKVYRVCKDSPGEFMTVSSEVLCLHVVLKETEDLIAEL
jgi:hypothetical protein